MDDDRLVHALNKCFVKIINKQCGSLITSEHYEDGDDLTRLVIEENRSFDYIITDNQMPNKWGSQAILEISEFDVDILDRITLL